MKLVTAHRSILITRFVPSGNSTHHSWGWTRVAVGQGCTRGAICEPPAWDPDSASRGGRHGALRAATAVHRKHKCPRSSRLVHWDTNSAPWCWPCCIGRPRQSPWYSSVFPSVPLSCESSDLRKLNELQHRLLYLHCVWLAASAPVLGRKRKRKPTQKILEYSLEAEATTVPKKKVCYWRMLSFVGHHIHMKLHFGRYLSNRISRYLPSYVICLHNIDHQAVVTPFPDLYFERKMHGELPWRWKYLDIHTGLTG